MVARPYEKWGAVPQAFVAFGLNLPLHQQPKRAIHEPGAWLSLTTGDELSFAAAVRWVHSTTVARASAIIVHNLDEQIGDALAANLSAYHTHLHLERVSLESPQYAALLAHGRQSLNTIRFFILRDMLDRGMLAGDAYLVLTDLTDVVFTADPFEYMRTLDMKRAHLRLQRGAPESLYVGYEERTSWKWWNVTLHRCFGAAHTRQILQQTPLRSHRLLSCGVVAGSIRVLRRLLDEMVGKLGSAHHPICDMAALHAVTAAQPHSYHLVHGHPWNCPYRARYREGCIVAHKTTGVDLGPAFGGVSTPRSI